MVVTKSQPGSANALGLLGHRDAFLLCAYKCLQNCKEVFMIHILIQLGTSVRYLCAADFINSIKWYCFTLNIRSRFFKGLGSAFSKALAMLFQVLLRYPKMSFLKLLHVCVLLERMKLCLCVCFNFNLDERRRARSPGPTNSAAAQGGRVLWIGELTHLKSNLPWLFSQVLW